MNPTSQKIVVGWKISALGLKVASVRYRALLPVLALSSHAPIVESKIFTEPRQIDLTSLDVLVLVKRLAVAELDLARSAADNGVAVIFDLCDNVFLPSYDAQGFDAAPAQVWRNLLPHLSLVVVPTVALAEVVRRHAGAVPVAVIPDGSEDPHLLASMGELMAQIPKPSPLPPLRKAIKFAKRSIPSLRRLAKLLRAAPALALTRILEEGKVRSRKFADKLARRIRKEVRGLKSRFGSDAMKNPGAAASPRAATPLAAQSILWFGNHGGEYASFGMLDLLVIRDALESVARDHDIELVVVSNNAKKFRDHILPFRLPVRYVEWSSAALQSELDRATAVVVPNSMDPFSACKSANRSVLALQAGVPVVATRTSALEPLAAVVQLDDFEHGLRLYLNDPRRRQDDVAHARPLIEALYGLPTIAALWAEQLGQVVRGRSPAASRAQLAVVVHLSQDLDLALPVAEQAWASGLEVEVWASSSVMRNSARVAVALQHSQVPYRVVPDALASRSQFPFPDTLRAMLTASETTLRPHAFTHRLTLEARSQGIFTATLQHGFENVGLTYSDAVHPIEDVGIAAERIYLWGAKSSLHPRVSESVRDRSIAVGCTKPARVPAAPLSQLLPLGSPVIGIFENLHWHRYSHSYRNSFVKSVQALALAFPRVTFLVKPHHAGMWLTRRGAALLPAAPNIVIADPSSAQWQPHTAAALLGSMEAVITSPSTVALDAARYGLPVAVVGLDLELENYNPLSIIRRRDDWSGFVASALDQRGRKALSSNSADFVRRTLVSDDGAKNVVADLASVIRHAQERFLAH